MTNQRLDLTIAAALLVFAAALWWWLIPVYAGAGEQVILPRLLTALIAGLAGLMFVLNLRPGRTTSHGEDDDPFLELGGGETASVLALVVVWGVFCFTLSTLGFYLGGALTLTASYLLLGFRRLWLIGLWTGGTLLAVYIVFEAGFQLVIRPGTLERLLLTLW